MNKVIIVLLISFSCIQLNGQNINPVDISINKNAKEFLEDDRIHSVSIGVYKDGLKYSGHFGELEIGKGNKPTDSTLYAIASVTKVMTGTVLANAVLEGKINLDDDIRMYLDGQYPNMEFNGVPIRIRDVITHTGGIPSNFPEIVQHYETDNKNDSTFFKVEKIYKNLTHKDFFELIQSNFLKEEPGNSFEYSNVGPQLIAHILENVYDLSFEELMIKHVFERYHMDNAQLSDKGANRKNYPRGYNENRILMPHLPNVLWGAAGRVILTMPDMLNFISYQLEERDVIVKESHQEVFVENDQTSYGYFFRIEKYEDGYAYMHNGYCSGTQNWFMVFPKYKLGISVITNTSFPNLNIWKVAMGIVDDLKPFGKKSIQRAIVEECKKDIKSGIALYWQLKANEFDKYNFLDSNELNNLGYELLVEDNLQGALAVFKLLVSEFPNDANAYDSLGEAYYYLKNDRISKQNYKRSLELNPENSNATLMINKIKSRSH